jgi:anti-sigma factor RsiW
MKCERAQEWFSDLLDGSIQPAQRVVLDAHLTACQSCSAEAARLRSLWTALDAMPDVAAPTSLRATIWQRIEAASADQSRRPHRGTTQSLRPWLLRGLVYAGAAVVLVGLATVTVPGNHRQAGLFGAVSRWIGPREQHQPTVTAQVVTAPNGVRSIRVEATWPAGQAPPGSGVVVAIRDGARTIADGPTRITGNRASWQAQLDARPTASLRARVSWTDEGGAPRSLVAEVRAP